MEVSAVSFAVPVSMQTLLRPSEGGDIAPLTPPMPHPLLVKEVMITIGMPVSMINDAFHNSSWAQSHALVMRSVLDRIENRYGSFGNEEVSHENSIGEDSADKGSCTLYLPHRVESRVHLIVAVHLTMCIWSATRCRQATICKYGCVEV